MGVSEVHETRMSLMAYLKKKMNKLPCLSNPHGSLSMILILLSSKKKATAQTDAPWQMMMIVSEFNIFMKFLNHGKFGAIQYCIGDRVS